MGSNFNPYDLDNEFFRTCMDVSRARLHDCRSPVYFNGINLESLPPPPYSGTYTDFYGLPSNPRAIYKTGDAWYLNPPPEAYRVIRELRPVCEHPMQDVWLDQIGKRIYELLDSLDVQWTSIDPVRFGDKDDKRDVTTLHIWVGVIPASLPYESAKTAAEGCKDVLDEAGFSDVEVAFRESSVIRSYSSGPKLLDVSTTSNPVRDERSPFTPALGLQIASLKNPNHEGTGALYIRESNDSERVFLLTAGHVAIPPSLRGDPRQSRRRKEIIVLGSKAYNNALSHLMSAIAHGIYDVKHYDENLERLGPAVDGEHPGKPARREEYGRYMKVGRRTIVEGNNFYDEVSKHWTTPLQRVLGHVVHSPPIDVAATPRPYTQDWALIDINLDKIDWSTFLGNKIYIGMKACFESLGDLGMKFLSKLFPHSESSSDSRFSILNSDGLLQIQGILTEDELHNATQLDRNGEKTALIVIKNGMATGVTLGRASSMESFVRVYSDDGSKTTSIEIAVYPYNYEDRHFSAPGDSGATVVDGGGRIVGMITDGAGYADHIDVTYLTPYWWIDEQIKKEFPDSSLYETVELSA